MYWPMNEYSPSINGIFSVEFITISGHMNEFHVPRKTKVASAARAGRERGITTCR